MPRWSLACVSGFVGSVCVWAGTRLSFREWTFFSVVTLVVAGAHWITAALAVVDSPQRSRAWRAQAIVSLTYLAYLTYNLAAWAAYVAELYGGLGAGIAWVLALFWTIVVALTVPLSAWGLVATGGVRLTKLRKLGGGVALVLVALSVWRSGRVAAAEPIVDASAVEPVLSRALGEARGSTPSLMTAAPAICDVAPSAATQTVVATHVRDGAPVVECLQAPTLEEAVARLDGVRGRIKIDVISAVAELQARDPIADLLAMRPALDGICDGRRCLMPWQLQALQAFNAVSPIDVLHEIRIGFDPAMVRQALSVPESQSIDGLTRIETQSFVTSANGTLVPLRRMRPPRQPLTPQSLQRAVRAAEDYLAAAQREDGRFEYRLDPFTGEIDDHAFSIARQAGTTLVLCELAEDRDRARTLATAALAMIATTASRHESLLMFRDPDDVGLRFYDLGDTALSAIAFLSCRDLVGDRFDAEIDGATEFLLAMQRDDGSFHPQFDLRLGERVIGADPLFAVGQAIFALTLREQLNPEEPIRRAVQAAMDYTADDYWNGFGADFFYMEENWHCLAARAALTHHRHDGYERFCVDYAHFKTRLILDESDGVDPDFVGGYGFGNFLIPHSSGSATFGEASAAALAIMDARDEPRDVVQERLQLALGFLVHHQWSETACFACSADHPIAGAFSEHMASPTIRIDYVQHAMGAMGHGGRVLGWL